MEFRPVVPEDNEQLIALSRVTPMVGDISVYIERSPDYFAFYNQYGDCYHHLTGETMDPDKDVGWVAVCAEEEGRIVGVVATVTKLVRFGDQVIRMALPSDARVHPDFQHQGIIKRLGAIVSEKWGDHPTDLVLGYVIKGNIRAQKGFEEGAKDIVTGVHAGNFQMPQISMYRPYKNVKLNIERATDNDIPEITELLHEFYADYNFSPVFNSETWAEMTKRSPGYSMNDIRVVREGGRIQALVGLWDQRQVRQLVTTAIPGKIKAGIAAAHAIRLFLKSPPPPKLNAPQTSTYIKHIAHRPGKLDLLSGMMKNITNEIRLQAQHNFIWGAFYETDPLLSIFDGLTVTRILSGQFYSPWNRGWFATPDQIQSKPCYADFSMV
jgi:hypothetical protein